MIDDFKFRAQINPRRRKSSRLVLFAALPLALAASGLIGGLGPDAPAEAAGGSPTQETLSLSIPLALPDLTEGATHPSAGSAQPPTRDTPVGPPPPGAVSGGAATPDTPADTGSEEEPEAVAERWVEREIHSGDSLARIFKDFGLSPRTLHRILQSSADAKSLADIRPGETLSIRLTGEGDFAELVLQRGPLSSLWVVHDGDDFKTLKVERSVETRVERVTGVIEDSLYASGLKAGLSEKLILELADIFGWDIDFALEVRSGDQFSVIYREEYLDGDKLSDGPILAAEFINQGRALRAVRYKSADGKVDYYGPDGRPMHKAFLRAPVDFRRISSRFQPQRYHPILGERRPHRGVDYAAATGTPVRAAGDGKIAFLGRKGGYGNALVIQHPGQYSTLYGHLNGFRRGLKDGSKVKQGQVIAYVGMTGLATGPHLHYEFRIDGVHRDPLTVKLPQSEPIAARYRADFEGKAAPFLAQLDLLDNIMMAEAR